MKTVSIKNTKKKAKLFVAIMLLVLHTSCTKGDDLKNDSNDPNFVLIDPNEITGIGEVSDYSLVLPQQWEAQLKQDRILILDKEKQFNGAVIDILKPFQGSGNLETDMNDNFDGFFNGWQKSGSNVLRYQEKGKTMQGFDYYLERNEVVDGNNNTQYAAVLLVQLKNRVGVVVYLSPSSSNLVHELSYILFSLRFNKESVGNITLAKDLIGPWSLTSLNAGAYMTYYGDGNFTKGGSTSFTVGLDATYNQITTTQFSATGSYKLKGNQLETSYKSDGKTYIDRVRFYSSKTEGASWKSHKATISIDQGWRFNLYGFEALIIPSQWDDEN
jgi:hypothetical protein